MITLERILWPTDFSDLSLEAGEWARHLHESVGAELHILHVCPVSVVAPALLDRRTGQLMVGELHLDERPALERMQRLVAERFQGDAAIRCHVRSGAAWRQICKLSHEIHADLIILATHGRTGLRHAFSAKTSERVARHARCPVLILKPTEILEQEPDRMCC